MGGRGASSASGATKKPTYNPWAQQEIDKGKLHTVLGKWKTSSSGIRHAINGRASSPVSQKTAEEFDNWVNSGSYNKTLYRGKRVTEADAKLLLSMPTGGLVDQDGPASFSKSESVAKEFARGGYAQSGANVPVVFELQGGTSAGRDIQNVHGFYNEAEVIVGSASKLKVNSVEKKNGIIYVRGTEVKMTFTPQHKKGA